MVELLEHLDFGFPYDFLSMFAVQMVLWFTVLWFVKEVAKAEPIFCSTVVTIFHLYNIPGTLALYGDVETRWFESNKNFILAVSWMMAYQCSNFVIDLMKPGVPFMEFSYMLFTIRLLSERA
eukprot:UN03305